MKLYRVEFRDRQGPWHSADARGVFVYPNEETGNMQPSPWEEGLRMARCMQCACVSVEQLRTWFAHVWRDLSSAGGRVVELEVDGRRVHKGTWQAIYPEKYAQRLRTFDLMENPDER